MNSLHRRLRTPILLTLLAAGLVVADTARANVYATNIKLNGSLTNSATASQGSSVAISYILNEAATAGVTINISSGGTVVRTISIPSGAGTTRGLNTVNWDGKNGSGNNVATGTYSVSITAGATGYSDWTQLTIDSDLGQYANYPWGMDVDRNTNSPYYGRVVVSSAAGDGLATNNGKRRGLYKMNADGSPADEGWFGNANYLTNDFGTVTASPTGDMPAGKSTGHKVPGTVRIGEDDRIYFMDASQLGAVVATDMQATTNQTVITSGAVAIYQGTNSLGESLYDYSHFLCQASTGTQSTGCGGDNQYGNCDLVNYLDQAGTGLQQFDICGLGTTNAAMYLVDQGDFPSWGIWCFRFGPDGRSDTNDTAGSQVVYPGGDPIVTGGGVMVDYNLDTFFGVNRSKGSDTSSRVLMCSNWNGGTLPPPNSGTSTTFFNGGPDATWKVGAGIGNTNLTGIWDTAINSRVNPTLVAVAMAQGDTNNPVTGYTGKNGGVAILSAVDGSYVKTNLDNANWYNCVAFDNVGNVYAASRSNNRWRSWSPPGANQATTTAVIGVQVTAAAAVPHISSVTLSGGNVTITFTADAADSATAFTLQSSSVVTGPYNNVAAAAAQTSPGTFQFNVATSGGAQFYRISR